MASAARKRIADSALVSDADLTCGVNYGPCICQQEFHASRPATEKKKPLSWMYSENNRQDDKK